MYRAIIGDKLLRVLAIQTFEFKLDNICELKRVRSDAKRIIIRGTVGRQDCSRFNRKRKALTNFVTSLKLVQL